MSSRQIILTLPSAVEPRGYRVMIDFSFMVATNLGVALVGGTLAQLYAFPLSITRIALNYTLGSIQC